MSKDLQIHVGETLGDIGARAVEAWHRIEQGEDVNEKHVSFATWETMIRVLSPKRLELLRHLHRSPAQSTRSLAAALHRDHRRVQEDVAALEAAGLLDRDETGIHADYDALDVTMHMAL